MNFWQGRRVLITGHTGFKGSWLSLWLTQLGADLQGIALSPPGGPSLFEEAAVGLEMRSEIADVRNLERVQAIVQRHRPEIVLHLAAEALVRRSYEDPVGAYTTNVLGTVNLLESLRRCDSVRAVVIVTSDKCYENDERAEAFPETARLGGYDPYSSSKACAELVVSAYRNSFFSSAEYKRHGVAIATARAGNVIGGGDWAPDRLIPDIMRAFAGEGKLKVRNPGAVRPWQHVLEPLCGYLMLAERLYEDGIAYGEAWNFGPELADTQPVAWIVRELGELWGGNPVWELDDAPQPHEAHTLRLDSAKATERLGWRPRMRLKEALGLTAQWYKAREEGQSMRALTLAQIDAYHKSLIPAGFESKRIEVLHAS